MIQIAGVWILATAAWVISVGIAGGIGLLPWSGATQSAKNVLAGQAGLALLVPFALTFTGAGLFFVRARLAGTPTLVGGTRGLWLRGTLAGSVCLAWVEVAGVASGHPHGGIDVYPTQLGVASASTLQRALHRSGLIRVFGAPLVRDPEIAVELEALRLAAGTPGPSD